MSKICSIITAIIFFLISAGFLICVGVLQGMYVDDKHFSDLNQCFIYNCTISKYACGTNPYCLDLWNLVGNEIFNYDLMLDYIDPDIIEIMASCSDDLGPSIRYYTKQFNKWVTYATIACACFSGICLIISIALVIFTACPLL